MLRSRLKFVRISETLLITTIAVFLVCFPPIISTSFKEIHCNPTHYIYCDNVPNLVNVTINITMMPNNREDMQMRYKGYKDVIGFHQSSMVREYSRFYWFKNMYVSREGTIATNNAVVEFYKQEEISYLEKVKFYQHPATQSYDHVIYLYSCWTAYGHIIGDCMCELVLIPEDIVNKSVFVTRKEFAQIGDHLEAIGYPRDKLILSDDWIHCQNLYTLVSREPENALNVIALPKLARLYAKKMGLDQLEQDQCALQNREKGKFRHIANLGEVRDSLNEMMPFFFWFVLDHDPCNLIDNARALAQTKILVCPSGSNAMNIIFMRPNSGVCLIGSGTTDIPNMAVAYSCGIWVINPLNPGVSHYKTDDAYCNVEQTVYSVRCLIYAVRNGFWPALGSNWTNTFNISYLWDLMGHNTSNIVVGNR